MPRGTTAAVSQADDELRDDAGNGSEEPAKKPARKKKRKRKRKKRSAPESAVREAEAEKGERRPRRWWIALVVIGLIELFLFGSRGRIRVCVAHEGEHDFALIDQPRTEENTRRYPTCEKRTNVGIVSHFDEARDHAMLTACQRAAVLRPKHVVYQCALPEDGWQHRVETSFVPPWDPVYYKRLFWFAFDD